MGYDQRETSGSSGAVVAVLVAVLLTLVLGGMLGIGLGAYFWLRPARMVTVRAFEAEQEARQMAQEARAVAEAKIAEADAPTRQAEALAPVQRGRANMAASDSQPDLTVSIGKDGSLSLDGEPIDLDGLQERLETMKAQAGSPPRLRIEVDSDCPHEHLIAVLDACRTIASEVSFRTSPSNNDDPVVEAKEVRP